MTGSTAILWPMIVQAFLTIAVYPILFTRRQPAVRAGEARFSAFRVPSAEPERSAAAARNLSNQYELPVLFYAVCLALYVTNGAGWLALLIAWVFALSRIAHAAIHLGGNSLKQRIPAFAAGLACVSILWILLALHVAGLT